jgi:hypothetical protein
MAAMAGDATFMADFDADEYLPAARNLRALRVRITRPGVEEVEPTFNLCHL